MTLAEWRTDPGLGTRAPRQRGVLARAAAEDPASDRLAETPWRASQLAASLMAGTVGAAGIALTWWGSASVKLYGHQMVWLVMAVLLTAVGVLGGVSWLVNGTRAVRLLRKDVLVQVAAFAGKHQPSSSHDHQASHDAPVWVDNGTRYHRPGCPFVVGKALVSFDTFQPRPGVRPCEVCQP
jgi:hypothetical protein